MSLHKLNSICKRLDAESSAAVRDFYKAVLTSPRSEGAIFGAHCTSKSGAKLQFNIFSIPHKKRSSRRMIIELYPANNTPQSRFEIF